MQGSLQLRFSVSTCVSYVGINLPQFSKKGMLGTDRANKLMVHFLYEHV